ncbi:hypothetical protein TNCV_5083491 [Trichonephila clavipes]|nr:hypothetical protein TNCV_5083491 [Trichonephila clavipes]
MRLTVRVSASSHEPHDAETCRRGGSHLHSSPPLIGGLHICTWLPRPHSPSSGAGKQLAGSSELSSYTGLCPTSGGYNSTSHIFTECASVTKCLDKEASVSQEGKEWRLQSNSPKQFALAVHPANEKVSNHGSIPITIDCNVVAFIVFEEGFHQPIKRTKQCRMSLCGMEFHACCVNTGTVNAGCGGCWSSRPMISHTCSIGDRSDKLAGQDNMSTLCRT